MASTKISALADGAPAVGTDVTVIERGGASNARLTLANISTLILATPTITGHPTVEGVTSTGATGTGKFVFDGSPTLVTPTLGVATATSINKMAITAPATSSTLAVADGKTATISNSLTLAGTDTTTMTFPSTSATIARTDAAQSFSGTQTFAGQANKTGQAVITATGSGINTSETVVLQTSAAIGANRLAVGTVVRVTLIGTCTASAANASHFRIRIGTAGTTSDTAAYDVTTPVSATSGTNVPFRVILEMTVRATGSGSSGTAVGEYTIFNQGTTGLGTAVANTAAATMTGFDTTANNFLSVTYVSAASTTTCTFVQGFIEIVNN